MPPWNPEDMRKTMVHGCQLLVAEPTVGRAMQELAHWAEPTFSRQIGMPNAERQKRLNSPCNKPMHGLAKWGDRQVYILVSFFFTMVNSLIKFV